MFGALRNKLMTQTKGIMTTTGNPIAIDFGTGSLKLLQVVRGETGVTLQAAAALETPEDLLHDPAKRLKYQADHLPDLVKKAGFKGKRAVCAIPGSLSFCKHMKVDKTGVPASAVVEAALVQQFGCHPSQMVFRHYQVAEVPKSGGGTQVEVICLAATRELVGRLMGAVQLAKLEPVGMHPEPLALVRAFEPIGRRTEDKVGATMYLDIGAGSTNMVIAHGQSLVFAKRIEMGGRYLDEAICKQTKVSFREARQQRASADGLILGPAPRSEPLVSGPLFQGNGTIPMSGTVAATLVHADAIADRAESTVRDAIPERRHPPSAVYSGDVVREAPRGFVPPQADLREPLEIMTDDIALAMRYYASLFPSRPVDKAVFIGGEARYKGLCQHIARSIRVSAQIADPMASVVRTGQEKTEGVDLRQPQPGWAVALGLCLLPTDL